MKITKPIDFQRVGELSLAMKSEKVSRERFSLEIPVKDCANGLYAAMKSEVEYRGDEFVFDTDTRSHIMQAAEWLTDPDGASGLLLCGLYGNGKTTLAKAVARLVGFLSEREFGYANRKRMWLYTSKEICRLCSGSEKFKEQYDEYHRLFREEMLIIDDLGEEPAEVLVYGMIHTPIIDLISERYAAQRMTIVSTNLDTDALKEKYGGRIYDRLREMLTSIIFENESYRKPKRENPVTQL